MGPIALRPLSTIECSVGLDNYQRVQAVDTSIDYSTASSRFSLRLDIYPSPQFLQIDGCLCHLTPASHLVEGFLCSRVPSLHGRYPASPLLRTQPPPSRLRPISRGLRLYGLPGSTDFSMGRGRFLQLLGLPLSPCCPYYPAGVACRCSQIATDHAAFTREEWARPPVHIFFEATSGFTCVAARRLAHHP